MACKNCEALQASKESLEWQLAEERKRTKLLRECLEVAKAKPSVEELLKTASAVAQIAKLVPPIDGVAVVEEASSVALAALKQVQERLKGDEPSKIPPVYDIVIDSSYSGEEGREFWGSPTHSFRVFRSAQAAFAEVGNRNKSVFVAPGIYPKEGAKMLVLDRKVEQEVVIQVPGRKEPIVIKVLWFGDRRVRLGVAADADIEIMRKELVE